MSGIRDSTPPVVPVGNVAGLRYSLARGLFTDGRWMDAIVEAEELLDEVPDHFDALFLVGEACLELGDAHGAETAYARFLELQPGHTGALTGLGIARYEVTDMDGCLSCTRQALDEDPGIPEAWYFQGLALQWLGLESESETALVKASEIDSKRFPLLSLEAEEVWNSALAEARTLLDDGLSTWLENVPIVAEILPELEVLRAVSPPLSPFCTGLYWGTPPDPELDPWAGTPEEIRLYRSNLERLALHAGDLPRRIAEVLRNEALDWLGLPLDAYPLRP